MFPLLLHFKNKESGLILKLTLFFAVTALAVIPFFEAGSGSEAREIHVASIMYSSGEYVLPFRNGIIPSKPLLLHWLSVLIATVAGGFPVWLPRIVSVFAGASILFLTGNFTQRIFSGLLIKPHLQLFFTWLPLFVLCTCYGFIKMALVARVDMLFALFTTAAAIVFYYACFNRVETGENSGRLRLAFWLLCGFAVLARGPLGIVLPVVSTAASGSIYWRNRPFSSFIFRNYCYWLPGYIFVLLIALPWYGAAWYSGGDAFLDKLIWFENVQRFTGGEQINSRPWYYYLLQLFRTAHIWWVLFLILITAVWRGKVTWSPDSKLEMLFYLTFSPIIAGLLFLSLSDGKRTSYLLPLYPHLALSIGALLAGIIIPWKENQLSRVMQLSALILSRVLILFSVFYLIFITVAEIYPVWIDPVLPVLTEYIRLNLLYFVVLACFLCLLSITAVKLSSEPWWHRRVLSMLFYSGTSTCIIYLATGLGIKYHIKQNESKAAEIQVVTRDASRIYVVKHFRDESMDSLLLYFNREVSLVRPEDEFMRQLPCLGDPVISYRRWYRRWKRTVGDSRIDQKLLVIPYLPDNIASQKDKTLVVFICGVQPEKAEERNIINSGDWLYHGV